MGGMELAKIHPLAVLDSESAHAKFGRSGR